MNHSPLLEKALVLLQQNNHGAIQQPILDLACGGGRNGLYLVENNIPVVFADVKASALEQVKKSLNDDNSGEKPTVSLWQVDFEQQGVKPLLDKSFSAIMVFRYLHRALFEQIKQAIAPGGYVIYETFTEDQPQFGRPNNPDFLLKKGELTKLFTDWQIIHSFEGVVDANNESGKQAIAQLIAKKPIESK